MASTKNEHDVGMVAANKNQAAISGAQAMFGLLLYTRPGNLANTTVYDKAFIPFPMITAR